MGRARYVLLGLLLALPFLGGVALTHAQVIRSGNNVTVPANGTIDNTLIVSGRALNIAGTVNGDVYCAGQNVTISATVNGDVLCAGQNLSVTGRVNGDVRLVGQNVTLGSQVSGSASVFSQAFTESSNASIGRDLSVVGQDITLNGTVGRDVAAASGTVIINNTVGRGVQANVRSLVLGSNAKVGGNINYTSSNSLQRSSSAQVAGSITRTQPAKVQKGDAKKGAVFGLLSLLYVFVALLLVALALVLLMPYAFHVASLVAGDGLLKTFLVGLAASIVVPVLLTILLLTVVGVPLAILAGLAWLLIVLLSGPFAAYLLGRLILRNRTDSAIWTMLVGAATLLILTCIPVLGWLVALVAMWFGVGTILRYLTRIPRSGYRMTETNVAERKRIQAEA